MIQHALGAKFTTRTLILYALPTIITMIFMSTYTIIDGIFVANFVGEDALSAINIIVPVFSIAIAIALMFATGANAIIGKLLGQHQETVAKQFFTTIYLVGIVVGLLLYLIFTIFQEQTLIFLGAKASLYTYSRDYLFMINVFLPSLILQIFTQAFLITNGKPGLSFIIVVIGGLTNIFLDYVFIVAMDLGIMGAALATGIGSMVPAGFGIIYFIVNRHGSLYFVRPKWNFKQIIDSMYNGMSECVNSISVAITTLLFNLILLNIAGKSGVAAISIILYLQMFQTATYTGYSFGISPIISFKYGAQDYLQLRKIIKISVIFILIISVFVILFSQLFAGVAVGIFINQNSETFILAKQGLQIFSIAYLFQGLNIFICAMFTALSNGKVSALLSFSRSFVFIILALLILPELIGVVGVWLAIPIAEFISISLAIVLYQKHRKIYHY